LTFLALPQITHRTDRLGIRHREYALRLLRVYPMIDIYRSRDGDFRIGRAEPELQRLLLGRLGEQIIAVNACRFFLVGTDPRRIGNAQRVIALERSLFRIDRHQRKLGMLTGSIAADDDTLIDDGGAQIGRSTADHVIAKEAGAAAVMSDSAFQIADEFARIRGLNV